MLTIAADRDHLGAPIGITAILHTWGSAMMHHPHIHMVVPVRRGRLPESGHGIPGGPVDRDEWKAALIKRGCADEVEFLRGHHASLIER
jgi:hypothetical protein